MIGIIRPICKVDDDDDGDLEIVAVQMLVSLEFISARDQHTERDIP